MIKNVISRIHACVFFTCQNSFVCHYQNIVNLSPRGVGFKFLGHLDDVEQGTYALKYLERTT